MNTDNKSNNGFGIEKIPFKDRQRQMLMPGCGWYELYSEEDKAKLIAATTEKEVDEISNKYEKIWEKINKK